MKNKLKYAIIVVGMLICITTFINYMNIPTIPDNTKWMEITYEAQDDGSLKLIEEQERVPMTLTNNGGLLIKCVVGLVMILWATFFYPEKRGESNK